MKSQTYYDTPRSHAVDGIPSFALHLFSILVLVMLFLYKEPVDSLIYFLVPALIISFPIFIYSRDPVNTFILSQYILISSFALFVISNPDATGAGIVIIVVLLNIIKAPRRIIIPPLGPVFFYVCISSVFLSGIYPPSEKSSFPLLNAYPT